MSALAGIAVEAGSCWAFAAIARERARAYGLKASPTVGRTLAAATALAPLVLAGRGAEHSAAPILAACAAVSAATDVETGLIYDRVLAAAAALLTAASICEHRLAVGFLGAAAGGLLLLVVYALGRGRAIGLGDVKFSAVAGLALGPGGALYALWLATVGAGAMAVILLASRRARRGDRLKFGPFLAAGAAIAMFGGS